MRRCAVVERFVAAYPQWQAGLRAGATATVQQLMMARLAEWLPPAEAGEPPAPAVAKAVQGAAALLKKDEPAAHALHERATQALLMWQSAGLKGRLDDAVGSFLQRGTVEQLVSLVEVLEAAHAGDSQCLAGAEDCL
eukprot:13125122-Alexandrium_andersonii.AAC.1